MGARIIKIDMKYHYRKGTSRRLRVRTLHYAGLVLFPTLIFSSTALGIYSTQAVNTRRASIIPKPTPSVAKEKGKEVQKAAITPASVTPAPAPTPQPQKLICSQAAKHPGLAQSEVSQLRKLAEYEAVCDGAAASTVSFFIPLPTTVAKAEAQGQETAARLRSFAAAGITPLVFMEPTTGSGSLVDIPTYLAGGYDSALDSYFQTIKNQGISDAQMGMWNPLPEWNIPVWGNTNPSDFASLITRTVQLQKKHFPSSKASILLESKSYPAGDSWANGAYTSFLPYVRDIPRGLLNSFGLQGFPWGALSEEDESLLDPSIYLRTDLAMEAARSLGVKEVWMNTGTFASFGKGDKPVTLSPAQRRTILSVVLDKAKQMHAAGFTSNVHLFANDKSQTAEKIDWAYWKLGDMASSPAAPIFKQFANDAHAAGIGLWLYDDMGN